MQQSSIKDARSRSRMAASRLGRLAAQASLGLLVVLVSGCHTVPLPGQLDSTAAPHRSQKIPVSIGLRFPAGFRASVVEENHYGDKWTFPVGESSERLLSASAQHLFERVVTLDPSGAATKAPDSVDAILEPSVRAFTWAKPLVDGTTATAVTYAFVLRDLGGAEIARFEVSGFSSREANFFLKKPEAIASEVSDRAMQTAAARFLREFEHVPPVRSWLAIRGHKAMDGAPVDAAVPSDAIGLSASVTDLPMQGRPEWFDPAGQGFVALRIDAENRSSVDCWIERSGIALVARDGAAIPLTPGLQTSLMAAGDATESQKTPGYAGPPPIGPSQGFAVVGVIQAVIGAFADVRNETLRARAIEYAERELTDSALPGGGRVSGLLYFRVDTPPDGDVRELRLPCTSGRSVALGVASVRLGAKARP